MKMTTTLLSPKYRSFGQAFDDTWSTGNQNYQKRAEREQRQQYYDDSIRQQDEARKDAGRRALEKVSWERDMLDRKARTEKSR